MSGDLGFISYKRPRTVISESVYQFMNGLVYGTAWGLVTPIPYKLPSASVAELNPAVFKPAPPFGALRGVPSNAIFFASILGWQKLVAKTVELVRHEESIVNELIGLAAIWPYHHYILNHSERRFRAHNRAVGGVVVASVLYAHLLA